MAEEWSMATEWPHGKLSWSSIVTINGGHRTCVCDAVWLLTGGYHVHHREEEEEEEEE
jgi:hypothetical protein